MKPRKKVLFLTREADEQREWSQRLQLWGYVPLMASTLFYGLTLLTEHKDCFRVVTMTPGNLAIDALRMDGRNRVLLAGCSETEALNSRADMCCLGDGPASVRTALQQFMEVRRGPSKRRDGSVKPLAVQGKRILAATEAA